MQRPHTRAKEARATISRRQAKHKPKQVSSSGENVLALVDKALRRLTNGPLASVPLPAHTQRRRREEE